MNGGYRSFIFDFDGTLADTAKLTDLALRKVAPALGLALPDRARLRAAIGYGGADFYAALYPDADGETRSILEERQEAREAQLRHKLKGELLFPGCRQALEDLRERGARLYIASTGGPDHVHPLLHQEGIDSLFARVRCGERDKRGMVESILEEAPGPAVMVGDMVKDYEAARANGIESVGACYGYCVPRPGTFDGYVYAPSELLDLAGDFPE